MTKKAERIVRFYRSMERLGFTIDEADKLRRIESTLHRWSEEECNGEVERDETTGKCYRSTGWESFKGQMKRHAYPIPDREAGALKRLEAIMAQHPTLVAYHQTDPRGCALYVIERDRIPADTPLGACYNMGFGVCY